MPPRGGLAQSLGEASGSAQPGPPVAVRRKRALPSGRRFHPPSPDRYSPRRRIRLVAYGARLESGLGVKALRGSNPLSSASGKPRLTWVFLVQVRVLYRLMC